MKTLQWLLDTPFAHRGLHHPQRGPVENSLSAFQAAMNAGFGFELDVQLSADKVAIVFHDATLNRLTGRRGPLADLTAAELSQIPLRDSPDHILPLGALLPHIRGRVPILVEVKGSQKQAHDIARATWQAVKDYDGPIAVMSFSPIIVRHFQLLSDGHIPCGLVASTRFSHDAPWYLRTAHGQQRCISWLQPDFIAYDIKSLPNHFSLSCRRHHLPLLTWTVRSTSDKDRAARFADNIIFEDSTDRL